MVREGCDPTAPGRSPGGSTPSWTRKPAPQVGAGFLLPPSELTTHRNPLEPAHPTWGHQPLNIITLIRVILILPTQLPGVGPIRVQLLRILTLKRGLHQKLTPPRSEDVVLLIPTQLVLVQLEVLPHPVTVHGDGVTDFPTQSEEHTSELQSRGHLVCRLLL